MHDLDVIRERLSSVLDEYADKGGTVLWLSGGKDSRLLLEVMIELGKPFAILFFEEGWDKEQRAAMDALIAEKNLQTFTYPALSNTLVAEEGEDAEIALLSQYAIDGSGNWISLIKDLVEGSTCAWDIRLKPVQQQAAPAEWACHVMGMKPDDRHWILKDAPLMPASGDMQIGGKYVIFPLFDQTDEDVIAYLTSYGVVAQDLIETGDIACCRACLIGEGMVYCPKVEGDISAVDWDRAKNLEIVRRVLGHAKNETDAANHHSHAPVKSPVGRVGSLFSKGALL